MMEFIKYASVAFTATATVATGWMQVEKFRLDGEWKFDTCTQSADLSTYEGLHLAWRVFLSDDAMSAPVVGDGEKIQEAFVDLAPAARFPARFVGAKEINSVSLTARFEGSRRASTGRFELEPTHSKRLWSGYLPFYQRNVDVLVGSFALTAGNARGHVRAVRIVNGEPVDTTPFTCEGATGPAADIIEPATGETEVTPE